MTPLDHLLVLFGCVLAGAVFGALSLLGHALVMAL